MKFEDLTTEIRLSQITITRASLINHAHGSKFQTCCLFPFTLLAAYHPHPFSRNSSLFCSSNCKCYKFIKFIIKFYCVLIGNQQRRQLEFSSRRLHVFSFGFSIRHACSQPTPTFDVKAIAHRSFDNTNHALVFAPAYADPPSTPHPIPSTGANDRPCNHCRHRRPVRM